MAEIQIEQQPRSLFPWLMGLALVALMVIGLTLVFAGPNEGTVDDGLRDIGRVQEKKKDETPRRLQQWALVEEAEPARAA